VLTYRARSMNDRALSLYRAAGIKAFQRLAVARLQYFGDSPIGSICRPPRRGRGQLEALENATFRNETTHILWLAATLPSSVVLAAVATSLAPLAIVLHVVLNVYPIMLQRYNRRRLSLVKERGRA
jgi:hypothetical protein